MMEFDDSQRFDEETENSCNDYITVMLPVELDVTNIQNLHLNDKEFIKGLNSVSNLCGKIVGLTNVGINPEKALDYLTDISAIESNEKISKINEETNRNNSKLAIYNMEKQSI